MIYKVGYNYTDFKSPDIDPFELTFSVGKNLGGTEKYRMHKWDGIALTDAWVDVGGTFVDVEGLNTEAIPDITVFDSSCLLLSDAAFKKIGADLAPYGEFLPITMNDTPYYAFNCLKYVEADKSVSEADVKYGVWLGVKSIGFPKAAEKNLVFRSKFNRGVTLYCGEEFKALVEGSSLTGLEFNENLLHEPSPVKVRARSH